MTVLIIGGTGFIGRRLIPLLAQHGEESVVMDINPQTANFSELAKVKVLRGDVSQFDGGNTRGRGSARCFNVWRISCRRARGQSSSSERYIKDIEGQVVVSRGATVSHLWKNISLAPKHLIF
jgi:NAD dependent epimerase/dehydratase family enzyme